MTLIRKEKQNDFTLKLFMVSYVAAKHFQKHCCFRHSSGDFLKTVKESAIALSNGCVTPNKLNVLASILQW